MFNVPEGRKGMYVFFFLLQICNALITALTSPHPLRSAVQCIDNSFLDMHCAVIHTKLKADKQNSTECITEC